MGDVERCLSAPKRQETNMIDDMNYLEYKGYKGSVEYSKEDDCLCGKVQGLNKALILYEGQTLDELRKDFEKHASVL